MAPSGERIRRKGRHGVFAGKTVWSMSERFEIYIVYKRRYINTLPFLFSFHYCTAAHNRGVKCRPFCDGFLPSEFFCLQFLLTTLGQLGRVLDLVLRFEHTTTKHVITASSSSFLHSVKRFTRHDMLHNKRLIHIHTLWSIKMCHFIISNYTPSFLRFLYFCTNGNKNKYSTGVSTCCVVPQR